MPKVIVTFMFDTDSTEAIYQDNMGQKPRIALRWLQDYTIASEIGKTLQKDKEKSDREGDRPAPTTEKPSLLARHDQSPSS